MTNFNILPLFYFSVPGGHLECDRGFPGERAELVGPPERGSGTEAGGAAVHHLLPAQQEAAQYAAHRDGYNRAFSACRSA